MIVLSVGSLKGGVGKTTVTLGLASAALSRGVPTLVVDLDPQADATTGLDVAARRESTVADVLANPRRGEIAKAVAPSGWAGDQPGVLDVMLGSEQTLDHDYATRPRSMRSLATALAKVPWYDLVLVDCPPSLGGLTRTGLVASDRALVVSEPAIFSVAAADRALRAVESLRRAEAPHLQPLGILVNRFRERSPEHRYRLEEMTGLFGPLVLRPPLPDRSAVQQSQGATTPVHRWPGHGATELATAFDAHLDRVLRAGTTRRTR
ncbi:ParA family protein [Aquipuribacter sp. SD81]|uniref:ParA family protein n=1 Tax=Aquipuribacter sp. SD81 TaxID=3127703 RepID=UPI003017A7E3